MSGTANDNCLDGKRCPECKSLGPFRIEAKSMFTVHDDGIEDYENVEWDDDSYCECLACRFAATMKEFTE